MKKTILFFLVIILVVSCDEEKKPLKGKTEWQKEMNAEFMDASKSPLKEKDRKKFESLDFFKVDSVFVVRSKLDKAKGEAIFKMKTTTDRLPEYIKYGQVTFSINGRTFKLNVYRNIELTKKEAYKDYLFLPFLDKTNGNESYGGGRYLDLRIPEGDTLIIDFNKAYNPYCAYNEAYSCPIVPRENFLDIEIRAGVKAFKKH